MKYKLALLSIFIILLCVSVVYAKPLNSQEEVKNVNTVANIATTTTPEIESVSDMIIRLTVDSEVSTLTALRIAKCESQLGTQMENPHSSAKGIYQFTYGTWNYACGGGDVMDNELNIKCFLKLYPLHPSWWECR